MRDRAKQGIPVSNNAELVGQLLDAAAFVFVTPEILGSERLGAIRRIAIRNIVIFKSKLMDITKIETKNDIIDHVFIAISSIVVLWFSGIVIFAAAINGFSVPKDRNILSVMFWSVVIGVAFCASLSIALTYISYLISSITSILAVRRTMFVVGAAMFFLARAVLVWHAWEGGEH